MLLVPVALVFEDDADATADKAARRAAAAAREILNDRNNLDRQTIEKVAKQLETTKRALAGRLISGTAYRRFTVQALAADVDRMLTAAHGKLAKLAENVIVEAASLGDAYAEEPVIAADLPVNRTLVGLDEDAVRSAYRNTAALLTQPMQQFAADVMVSIRRIAVAGDNPSDEIARLRGKIEGKGIEGAYFKAERIIRTEQGRTFNDATDSRLVRIADSFPSGLVGKGWRAAMDRRTRLGHRQAAETYARGSGIPVSQLFRVNVYQERPGTAPKLIGVATMRFPIDPDTKPFGRVSAAATIMCRCNAFVDINTASYANYVRSRVSIAFNQGPADAPTPRPVTPSISRERPGPQPKPARVRPVRLKLPSAGNISPSTEPLDKQARRAVKQTKKAGGV
jgi:hypothetical protein